MATVTIRGGTNDIAVLVREHARDNDVPFETAAFEVITFLTSCGCKVSSVSRWIANERPRPC